MAFSLSAITAFLIDLCYLDLYQFKSIDGTGRHQVGDKLLRQFTIGPFELSLIWGTF